MVVANESRAKSWCFTINNYTPAIEAHLQGLGAAVEYLVYGREVGDGGTPHLQGFVKFADRKRFSHVRSLLGSNPHLEVARNIAASVEYCKKDGNIFELGTLGPGQGHRSDLESFKDAVKGGMFSLDEIREDHSAAYARHPRFCLEYIRQHQPARAIEPHPLRPWQQLLNARLNLPADDRTIVFLVDPVGNSGKTWFSHYYASLHDNVQVMQPGKKADMAYALKENIRVLFIDAPRSKQGEFLQYDFLEDCKNGYVFSPKYESRVKQLDKLHLVVNMNESPDMTKLSLDRYSIVTI